MGEVIVLHSRPLIRISEGAMEGLENKGQWRHVEQSGDTEAVLVSCHRQVLVLHWRRRHCNLGNVRRANRGMGKRGSSVWMVACGYA